MSEAERLNRILEAHAPAAWAMLSDVGRKAAFPLGIPAQSTQANGTALNATIGQVTDGEGGPLPLASMATAMQGLDPKKAFLYAPQSGHADLRKAWAERQRRLSGGSTVPTSLPLVTLGLTQGLAFLADLFGSPETTVLLPDLIWENYALLFTLHAGCEIKGYNTYADGAFDVKALEQAMADTPGRLIVVLGFPGNPTGFMPTKQQALEIARVVTARQQPSVIVVDDAYASLVYEPGLADRSLFWDVLDRADPKRHFVARVDGSTKELFFYPGRIGFLTHNLTGPAAEVMESKLKYLGRGTVGSAPGPSQALVLAALQTGDLEEQIEEGRQLMEERYRALKHALAQLDSPYATPLPFNAGLFGLVQIDPNIDVESLRLHLIKEYSVGTIAIPEQNALRIAYCSVKAEDLPEVVLRLGKALKDLA